MPFTKTPFKINSYRAKGFNPSPFSTTPFELKSFKETPFQIKPFDLTPFLKVPFNNPDNDKLWTPLERIQYTQYMRSQLPSKKARDYFKNQREYQEYLKNKREQEAIPQEESLLANHKDGTEINSLRDVLLGAHNKHMKHTIEIIPETLGSLNIIPDTLAYWWKFYFKPTLKGKPLQTLANVLGGIAEDIDAVTLTTPVKAIAQALINGDNVFENLQAATIGTEEGIKNFDWDTGNGWADFGLELASDPTTYIPIIGGIKSLISMGIKGAAKASLKGVLKGVAKEVASEAGEQVVKNVGQEIAEGLTKTLGKEITEESIERGVLKGFNELWGITKSGLDKTDAYKQLVNKTITKEVKGASQKFKTLQDLIKINQWDSFKNLDEAFDHRLVDYIIKTNKIDPKETEKILEFIRQSGINKTAVDLMQDSYTKMTNNVLYSLHNNLAYIDDLLSGTVIKAHLTPLGAYPLYRSLKKGKLYKIQLKQNIKQNDQQILNKFMETNKAPGSFLRKTDFMDTTDIDTRIRKTIVKEDSFDTLVKQGAVQSALTQFGSALTTFIYDARRIILNDNSLTAAQKREKVLEAFKVIKSDVNTEEGIKNYLKEAEQKIIKARSRTYQTKWSSTIRR